MNQIYFEAKGEALLERIGMTKAEFARRMGIRKQNVKALFKSKNLETIYKAAGVMDVPFEMLIGYIEEPDLIYHDWKKRNPEAKKYNFNLKDDINIRYVSLEETAGQASMTYLSTLAVLQLDAILTNAVLVETTPANPKKKNQKGFKSMLRMSYSCPGIGLVKMMVGVKQSDKTKVQYCITAIDTAKTIKQEAD